MICAVKRCEQTARWTVTITDHPHVHTSVRVVKRYCTEHAKEKASTLWEDSPKPYTITVEGPT